LLDGHRVWSGESALLVGIFCVIVGVEMERRMNVQSHPHDRVLKIFWKAFGVFMFVWALWGPMAISYVFNCLCREGLVF
jgi:hypothetical protein